MSLPIYNNLITILAMIITTTYNISLWRSSIRCIWDICYLILGELVFVVEFLGFFVGCDEFLEGLAVEDYWGLFIVEAYTSDCVGLRSIFEICGCSNMMWKCVSLK